ncbi:thioredoxin family protein [Sediminimonas sp.]|uniref:SoxW family protein n=1 Tax=Sediminimonas sp. TaxID=2823379 RepID=UPI0025E37322|nr:thioredoxin family protein [Sediminimonas sp.]
MKRLITAIAVLAALAVPAAAETRMGDDGLHKTEWMRTTFMDLREDLADANAEGKRLAIIVEQRGCIYCRKMHEEVFPDPEIEAYIRDNFYVLQVNMFGDLEVTDFDGESLPEKKMVRKWALMFTPTFMFFPETVEEGQSAAEAAVAVMPGAFGKGTTMAMLRWVKEKRYERDEPFQKFVARTLEQ